MQWTAASNSGFSAAPPHTYVSRLPDGGYGPKHVNVEASRRDPDSLFNFVRLLAHRYRQCPELGWGSYVVLDHPVAPVLAIRSTWEDASMLAVHNLASEAVAVPLTLGTPPIDDAGQEQPDWSDVTLVDLLSSGAYPDEGIPVSTDGRVEIPLEGYGHAWLRIHRPGQRRLL